MFWWMFFYFIAGCVTGSFLNCCALRLPQGRSLWGRSACERCGHLLSVYDLVPVVSYLYLRGKCRYCQTSYGSGNLMAELLTGCVFVLCGLQILPGIKLLMLFVLASCLILISLIDFHVQIIPDYLVLIIALCGIAFSILYLPGGLTESLKGSAAAFTVMLTIFILSRGGMGGGDVKLGTVLGLWLGFEHTIMFLLLAFMMGGFISCLLLMSGVKERKDAVPFGPFLCAGALISVLYARPLAAYYWSLF